MNKIIFYIIKSKVSISYLLEYLQSKSSNQNVNRSYYLIQEYITEAHVQSNLSSVSGTVLGDYRTLRTQGLTGNHKHTRLSKTLIKAIHLWFWSHPVPPSWLPLGKLLT